MEQHGLGATYPPGDSGALATQISSLLTNPTRYAGCQANIDEFVRQAGWDAVSRQHARRYEEALAA